MPPAPFGGMKGSRVGPKLPVHWGSKYSIEEFREVHTSAWAASTASVIGVQPSSPFEFQLLHPDLSLRRRSRPAAFAP
jgi:hypothetical protein